MHVLLFRSDELGEQALCGKDAQRKQEIGHPSLLTHYTSSQGSTYWGQGCIFQGPPYHFNTDCDMLTTI